MTAVNVVLNADAVHLITDGAAVATDGTLGAIGVKVMPLPHLRAAIAYSGPMGMLSAFADVCSTIGRSYDDLRAGLADYVRQNSRQAIEKHGVALDVAVAGWSDRTDAPAAFVFDTGWRGGPAYVASDVELANACPGDKRVEAEIFPRIEAGDFDVEQLAGDLVELQRSLQADCRLSYGGGGATAPNVGVFVQLTTVTRDEIKTRIVRRWWQDVVGERLGRPTPAGFAAFASLPPSMRGLRRVLA